MCTILVVHCVPFCTQVFVKFFVASDVVKPLTVSDQVYDLHWTVLKVCQKGYTGFAEHMN